MNKTKIEWCDMTWNPISGCMHNCEYCYAKQIARRFGDSEAECGTIRNQYLKLKDKPFPYGFDPTFHRYRLDEPQKTVKPKNIFVCSMADLFGEWVPDEWIEKVFDACANAPQHRYLFLTKNPKRFISLEQNRIMPADKNNMWFGNTLTRDDDGFFYTEDTGYNGFLSIEPILSEFDSDIELPDCIKWVIIGAETGNRKNKVIPQKSWIDNICKVADMTSVKVFMKDSLFPIVGEENMRREFPWDK